VTDDSRLVGIDSCLACGKGFMFDPDTVVTVPIDPVSGLPPDMGGDPDRVVLRPVCDPCIELANPGRVRNGLPAVPPASQRYKGMSL
jgi:hypothetical protein